MTSAVQRLLQFVNDAPAGTMVPVESLRDMLAAAADAPSKPDEPRLLSPAEAADWLHAQLGGRKRTAAAVRKVMRTGFRGVVLKSYPYGRERRTTEADLRVYVAAIGAHPRGATPPQLAVPVLSAPSADVGFQVKSDADPADEIATAQERFRRRHQPPPRTEPRARRAAGGK